MPLPRLLTLLIGLSVILGMALWLINSLYRLYIQIAFTAPLLANLLLFLLILLLGAIIFIFVYYYVLPPKKRRTSSRRILPRIPEQKTEAAQETLKAVRQQVDQIQDDVARQALLDRSQEISANLQRRVIQVVVFGTGSAGKTSLINALMGEVVGQVNAPMGTTQVGETYSLMLHGIDRQILITDTPGILEAGVAGTQRGQIARELATEADLLLFVVDNDLRKSEYEPLQVLAEIGKRNLLILNKIDLYTEDDIEQILTQLRQRVQGFIAPSDVVAVCGNPQPFRIETGEIVQPEPEIIPLIKRLAAILRAEGEDLVADNILLQSQRLGEEARRIIDRQRRQQAEKIIERYQWIGAGAIAVTPLPVLDMLAAAAVNAQMVVEIGKIYGCDLNMERGRELAFSLGRTLVSLGVVKGAVELLARALQFTVATYVVGKAIQGVTAAYLTRIAGKSFIEYFRHDQDWGDGGITEVVQRQFKLVQKEEFVKAFIQDAVARIIKPLADRGEVAEEDIVEEVMIQDDWGERNPRNYDDW